MPVRRQKRGQGTYDDIAEWVKIYYGFTPHASWIANCKEMVGLPVNCPYTGIGRRHFDVLRRKGK
jgi:hypothetical protein